MRDLLRFGRKQYRAVFEDTGKAGAYVLADLRNFAKAKPEQIDCEALDAERQANPEQYVRHMERIRCYRRIRRFLDITDEEIDRAEERIGEIQRRGDV